MATFIDLSKAFDTIKHSTLFYKLNKNGIIGQALNLTKSYLENRQMYVTLGSEKSNITTMRDYGFCRVQFWGPCFSLYT